MHSAWTAFHVLQTGGSYVYPIDWSWPYVSKWMQPDPNLVSYEESRDINCKNNAISSNFFSYDRRKTIKIFAKTISCRSRFLCGVRHRRGSKIRVGFNVCLTRRAWGLWCGLAYYVSIKDVYLGLDISLFLREPVPLWEAAAFNCAFSEEWPKKETTFWSA